MAFLDFQIFLTLNSLYLGVFFWLGQFRDALFSALIQEILHLDIWWNYIYRICTWFLLMILKKIIIPIYPTIPTNFPTLLGSYTNFSSPSEKTLSAFFLWLWPWSVPSLPLLLANVTINVLSIFVSRVIMLVEMSQKYLELPEEMYWLWIWKQRRSTNISFGSSKHFWLSFTTIISRQTKLWGFWLQNSRKRAEDAGCSAVKATKKSRKSLWRSWKGPEEFEAKGLRDSHMIPKELKVQLYCRMDWDYYFLEITNKNHVGQM